MQVFIDRNDSISSLLKISMAAAYQSGSSTVKQIRAQSQNLIVILFYTQKLIAKV